MTPDWNSLVRDLPNAHFLQSHEWGQVKSEYGWEPFRRTWPGASGTAAAAQMLVRRVPIGGLAARVALAYVPRGPLLDWGDDRLRDRVLKDLVALARKQGAMFVKIDPELPLGSGIPGTPDASSNRIGEAAVQALKAGGWIAAPDQVQYRNTVVVDLAPNEDALLAAMKQKTRYNIRLAGRRGVVVRPASPADFEELYRMYAETAVRDGFVIRERDYYLRLWQACWEAGALDPLVAAVEGEAVAAVVVFRFAGTAVYMQGMSRDAHREKMPNYLLQWEAMRRARDAGCTRYDLWGAPDRFDESDPMWGVFRFKEGFGGTVFRWIGAWDYPIRPFFYRLYTQVMPRVLGRMRRRGREQTRSEIM